jgi:hypothetical protein
MSSKTSQDYMERMRRRRKICELQKKLLDLEMTIRGEEKSVAHEKIPPSKPAEEPTPYTMFLDRVRVDIAHNIISQTYSYSGFHCIVRFFFCYVIFFYAQKLW